MRGIEENKRKETREIEVIEQIFAKKQAPTRQCHVPR